MKAVRAAVLASLVVIGAAGCSTFNKSKPAPVVDPNTFPANYRLQIASLLTTMLTDRADFRGALIAAPVLKPIGPADHPDQHYVVCLALNGHNERRVKVVYYLEGIPTQFIDAAPGQCDAAAYQPFTELEYTRPGK